MQNISRTFREVVPENVDGNVQKIETPSWKKVPFQVLRYVPSPFSGPPATSTSFVENDPRRAAQSVATPGALNFLTVLVGPTCGQTVCLKNVIFTTKINTKSWPANWIVFWAMTKSPSSSWKRKRWPSLIVVHRFLKPSSMNLVLPYVWSKNKLCTI